jgi:hypothetical protein
MNWKECGRKWHGLSEVISQHFPRGIDKSYKKGNQSEKLISGLRSGNTTSEIQHTCAAQSNVMHTNTAENF